MVIDDADILWPHICFDAVLTGPTSALPPAAGDHHLSMPGDVTLLLGTDPAHRAGINGKGVRLAMIDSSFAMDHACLRE